MRRWKKYTAYVLLTSMCMTALVGCKGKNQKEEKKTSEATTQVEASTEISTEASTEEQATEVATEATTEAQPVLEDEVLSWDSSWKYADFSAIHSDDVTLYRSKSERRRDIVVAVNAGHGTKGAEGVQTYSHPDKSAKVTGGTTSKGAVKSSAISTGTDFRDGTHEADATLSLAMLVKDELLKVGFDVLMIRENDNTQLDNIARTVFANQYADYHVALHYDGTENDKGAFYISVPDEGGYRDMEPVASIWQQHHKLGKALLEGMRENGVKIFGEGEMALDLTQTSFSTIPSVDLEVGDSASDHGRETQSKIAQGIVRGFINLDQK